MKQETRFQSENFLMSVLGHLVLVVIIITSFSVAIKHAKLVSNNRVKIIELDLKSVKISGDETKLYNTTALQSNDSKEDNNKNKKNIPDDKIDLKQPTMIDNIEKNIKKEENNKSKKQEDKPLPRKKKLVHVNREVLSLDRTMTVSVIDALRVALKRCWVIDTNRPGLEDIRITAHIKFLPTGVVDRLWFESESRAQTDTDFAYVLETAKAAIKTCSPFTMLPRNEYDKWRDTSVTFYPSQGNIM